MALKLSHPAVAGPANPALAGPAKLGKQALALSHSRTLAFQNFLTLQPATSHVHHEPLALHQEYRSSSAV